MAEEASIADVSEIQTRLTATGYELRCPECQRWVKALLTTEAGAMCATCWSQAKAMLRGVPE